jgi:GT2 family glycosyltransferase
VRARASLLLLLNNDVLLHEQALAGMLAVLDTEPGAAICGTRMVFPDGTIQHNGVVFGPRRIGPYHVDRRRPSRLVPRAVREFQAVTGACMLVRAERWQELGGLDDSYSFGLEDIDFCLRARQRGARVFCAGNVDSLHFESMTPGRIEFDVPSRRLFMERWEGRYTLDG